jgi:hypothetical protein
MSKRKHGRAWIQWSWAVLAAAPVFAQDPGNEATKRFPPPLPTPPAVNAPIKNAAPRVKQTAPAKTATTQPPAAQPPGAQPPASEGPVDPTTSPPTDARKIIDSHATNPAQKAAEQREALLIYQQALAAQQANRTGEALRLGRRAKQLFPANQEISNFVAQLQRETSANKMASPSTTKAKAYLAAGYARGSEFMRTGRTAQGEDLLLGVMEASRLFAEQTQVDFYRRLAEHELEQFRLTQQNGTPPAPAPANADPNVVPPPPVPEPPRPAATIQAPPDNARRLVSPEGRVPSWYVQQKNRLARSMTVDYRGNNVASILDDIAAKTGVSFVIDRPVALARSHINSIVDFRVGDMPAEFILDLVCQKAGFEYVLMERSIVITTRSKALEYLRGLPEALRNNWLVARTLFPEMALEQIAAMPTPALPTQQTTPARGRPLEEDVPLHLQSGAALVAAIRVLLK